MSLLARLTVLILLIHCPLQKGETHGIRPPSGSVSSSSGSSSYTPYATLNFQNSKTSQGGKSSSFSYPERIPTLQLELVLILPDDSKRSLSLSRTLARTLNQVTAADLVSQLEFPEKNLTWVVRNFVVDSVLPSSSPFHGDNHLNDNDVDLEDEGGEYDEDYVADEGGRRPFSPSLIPQLCTFLGQTRAVALVTLLKDPGSHRLLSLVSKAMSIPLIGSAHPLEQGVGDLEVSLVGGWLRELTGGVVALMIHCQWHSFTVLTEDSMLASEPLWRQQLTSNLGGTILHPHFLTLQTRFENSAFRALSHLSNATQGVILLILSPRSAMQVFQAANRLRMLNGQYVFILLGPFAQFEKVPEWLPPGVLALRTPRPSHFNKAGMRWTGTLIANAVIALKDRPLVPVPIPLPPLYGKKEKGVKTGVNVGGVFSGFTNTDFGQEEEDLRNNRYNGHNTDYNGGEGGSNGRGGYDHSATSGGYGESGGGFGSATDWGGSAVPPGENLLEALDSLANLSCWEGGDVKRLQVSMVLTREMRELKRDPGASKAPLELLNLIAQAPSEIEEESGGGSGGVLHWQSVGSVSSTEVRLQTIRWPGGGIFGPGERPIKGYRVVTIVAPPFVMESQAEDNQTCVRGLPCIKLKKADLDKDDLTLLFAEGAGSGPHEMACCDGLAMDLLASMARELKFHIHLFLVPDGYFGSRNWEGKWNGLMGALVSGGAHMSFAPFSVTSIRATEVEFSSPFFFSGVGLLGLSKERDVPLLAFLAPFSPELWAAIFITLNLTALVVAIYEWFSPFGLNPWGRQRTKNFSISSALWVVWGRLFSHLVAFKAPKSWPNKFLINVWGGFSVIFVASYTANIAALFAGLFFERHVDVNDRSRVTAVKHSATDFYIKRENPHLWEHIQKFPVHSFHQGVEMLKNQTLDLLIGDGPLLDYYRGTDSKCSLIDVSDHDKIGDDTYAVAMTRGFPIKASVSSVISKYLGNGYMDYLQGKWYGQMPCFSKSQQLGARALGVDAVLGMFIMISIAVLVGILISGLELLIFKHALPYWRAQPKGTLWRSPNLMFFSQKLYRFINCVELVSPHHAARELANSLRQGQITSLFQKSVKRKEHEQRRRRKSKAQFYEMIQEMKRAHMADKQENQEEVFSIHRKEIILPELPPPPATSSSTQSRRIQFETPSGQILPRSLLPTLSHSRIPFEAPPTPIPPHVRLASASGSGCSVSSPAHNLDDSDVSDDDEDDRDETDDSYEMYSPLDKADLQGMTKGQIIHMWRTSELDLRRQLSQALKAKDELADRLETKSQSQSQIVNPTMLLEFDQDMQRTTQL